VTSSGLNGEIVTGNLQITLNLLHALQQAHNFEGNLACSGLMSYALTRLLAGGHFYKSARSKSKSCLRYIAPCHKSLSIRVPEDEYTTTAMEMIHKLDRVHARHTKRHQRLEMQDLT
jgi:hypothetical protein